MEELMEIEVNDNRIRLHDFLMFQAQCNIKLKEKGKEIERLNNIINELEKWLKEEQVNSVDLDEWTIIQVRDKILELKGDSNGKD